MTGDTDFLKLYRQLGVHPGCSLQTFKQAYRRRVRELHPDRIPTVRDSSERLKELNLDYAAALAFHRRHDRLPGTAPDSRARFSRPPPAPERTLPARTLPTRRHPSPALPYEPPNRWLLLVFSLVAIIPLCTLLPSHGIDATGTPDDASTDSGAPTEIAPVVVELGMDAASVAALLGAPEINADNEEHWFYGPSWIRFECGEVVEWHSSVLRPLPVADPGTASHARAHKPARRPKRCTARPRRTSRVHPADRIFAPGFGLA